MATLARTLPPGAAGSCLSDGLAREQRKPAAILAADVVGHSRLMGRDESCTPARLRGVNLGDGALVEFASAVNAALAAATECPLNRPLPSSRPQISDGKPD